MANQFLKLRRSAVPGRIPSTSSLDFGEIALNTYDGLAFIKKSGSAGEQVVPIGITLGSFTGSFSGSFIGSFTGSLNGTASWATNAISASYVPASAIAGLNLSRITTGSITASVDVDPNNLFLIKSGSNTYFNIANNSDTTISSNQFIVKNFTTQEPILTVSQSIVQFATQSSDPINPAKGGDIWFTSTELYVGLN
jgi:hypothetical protein